MVIYRTYADAWNPHGFLMDMYTAKDGTLPTAWNDETLQNMIDSVLMTTDETERQKQYDFICLYTGSSNQCSFILPKKHIRI